jgi:hypothetical protein
MSSIKLLPGVGYSGLFDAMPSIRGGQPGDLMAAMDGFYIDNPYHWGGGFSIFDPRMVKSAQLSHGVFSTRYGNTISGLLDITTRKPSSQDVELELGLSTSVANASVSFPINHRGGIMVMGKITYYDPVIWGAQALAKAPGMEILQPVEAITTAPYIRSTALTSNYRFTDTLEMSFTGFFGADGVAASYKTEEAPTPAMEGYSNAEIAGHWINYQGFGLLGLTYNPRRNMLLKFSAGGGYQRSEVEGHIAYTIKDLEFNGAKTLNGTPLEDIYGPTFDYETKEGIYQSIGSANAQGRFDFDWELGGGFLMALGAHELYSKYFNEIDFPVRQELWTPYYVATHPDLNFSIVTDFVNYWMAPYQTKAENQRLASSGYYLVEYSSPAQRFGAELGLRLDHLYFMGDGFSKSSEPALNPRLNLDFNLFRNKGPIESMSLSLGTGLFSSNVVDFVEAAYVDDFALKPNRSLTSVGGLKIEFPLSFSIDIEGYYKYVFDRTYVYTDKSASQRSYNTDGEGQIWGFDLMLRKLEGRYIDGWIAYSFNSAMYREPGVPGDPNTYTNVANAVSSEWYYPSFHRFHVLNLIFNIKPSEKFAITTRFGLASGVPLATVTEGAQPYSVTVLDKDGNFDRVIQRWKQIVRRDSSNRVSVSLPMDIKFSFFKYNLHGKAHQEFYVAIENVLSLVHTPKGNTTFNTYTGKENTGSMSASYDIPIPIPSFGFKWSY